MKESREKNSSPVKRVLWVDYAKGMGILAMLTTHAIPKETHLWLALNQFDMALFFFLSGYMYRCIQSGGVLAYAAKKIRGIYIPYVAASVIMQIVAVCIGQGTFSLLKLFDFLLLKENGYLLGAFWFLKALFFAALLFDGMNRVLGERFAWMLSIIAMLIGIHVKLPYRTENILVALGFIAIGNICSKLDRIRTKIKNGCFFIPGFILIDIISRFNRVSFSKNSYTYPLVFILSALIGILATIDLAVLLAEKKRPWKALSRLGENSLGVVIWQFVAFKVGILCQILVYDLPWSKLADYPVVYEYAYGLWIPIHILLVLLISPLLYECQKWLTRQFFAILRGIGSVGRKMLPS